jgi:hypothetical protein
MDPVIGRNFFCFFAFVFFVSFEPTFCFPLSLFADRTVFMDLAFTRLAMGLPPVDQPAQFLSF